MSLLISIALTLLAIPAGFYISWLTRDEIIEGRIWFKFISVLFLILGLILVLINKEISGLTSFSISIMSSVSYCKSFDKKWTKK